MGEVGIGRRVAENLEGPATRAPGRRGRLARLPATLDGIAKTRAVGPSRPTVFVKTSPAREPPVEVARRKRPRTPVTLPVLTRIETRSSCTAAICRAKLAVGSRSCRRPEATSTRLDGPVDGIEGSLPRPSEILERDEETLDGLEETFGLLEPTSSELVSRRTVCAGSGRVLSIIVEGARRRGHVLEATVEVSSCLAVFSDEPSICSKRLPRSLHDPSNWTREPRQCSRKPLRFLQQQRLSSRDQRVVSNKPALFEPHQGAGTSRNDTSPRTPVGVRGLVVLLFGGLPTGRGRSGR
jgi:hypothetical protein